MKTPVLTVSVARSSVGRAPACRAYSRASSLACCSTNGCSGATTKKVAPKSVSGRVVNTGRSRSSSSTRKRISAPSLRPIQLRWIAFVRSGHSPPSGSSNSSSSSAYAVIRKNHCVMFRASIGVPQRSQRPSVTYASATTVWSFGHQLTGASLRYARSRSKKRRNSHCVQR